MIIIIISASKAILKFTVFYAFAPELRQMVLRLYDQLFLSLWSSIYKFILPFFMLLQKYSKLTLWYALTANFPLSIIPIRFCVRIHFKVEPFGPAYLVSFSQKMKFAFNSIELTFKFWSSLIGNFKFQIEKITLRNRVAKRFFESWSQQFFIQNAIYNNHQNMTVLLSPGRGCFSIVWNWVPGWALWDY